jgi:predicted dithiol-disulfide oxidoreductase (DUF899 family)
MPEDHSGRVGKPEIVTAAEWQKARDELLEAEKEATRALDVLAAHRRRLPMVEFEDHYTFDTPDGARSLLDLFDGRQQLMVYQFMDNGPDHYCPGCTWITDNIPPTAPALLADNGITWTSVSDMPLAQIEKFWKHLGWTLPFASSRETTFSTDTGAGEGFLLSVFLRDGDRIYRTYSTTGRGIERLVFATGALDLTVYGRREAWEDSPPGWPQAPTYMIPAGGSQPMMEPDQRATGFGRYR